MTDRTRRNNGSQGAARAKAPSTPPAAANPPERSDPAAWEPWLRLLQRWYPLVGVAVAVIAGATFGLATAILVLAATALLFAIATLWASLQSIAGESVASSDDVLALAMPGTEYEQKQAVLRALKDLEYERSVGKISDEDYEDLRQRYRAKARAVLQNLDREVQPTREEAEKAVAAFLKSKGIQPYQVAAPSSGELSAVPAPEPASAREEPAAAANQDKSRKCAACGVPNDSDAAFCKKCGHRLEEAPRLEAGVEP